MGEQWAMRGTANPQTAKINTAISYVFHVKPQRVPFALSATNHIQAMVLHLKIGHF